MLLTTAAFLMLLGLGTWVLGVLFDFAGIAVIGATIVIGVGATFTATGLNVPTGETTENNLTVVNNSTTNDTEMVINDSETRQTTTPVDLPTRLPLGLLVILLGGVAGLRGIDISRGVI